MSYDVEPDPDFRLADAGSAEMWRKRSAELHDRGTRLRKIAAAIDEAHTVTVAQIVDSLEARILALNTESRRAGATAALYDACALARSAYVTATPTVAEIQTAWENEKLASEDLRRAADTPRAGRAREALKAAGAQRRILENRRHDAIVAYEDAEDAAVAAWDDATATLDGEVAEPPKTAPAPNPGATAPAPDPGLHVETPPPGINPEAFPPHDDPNLPLFPVTPGTPAPPTGEVPAPGTNVAGGGGGGLDSRSMEVGALLNQAQQGRAGQGQAMQPQTPMQAQVPPMPPLSQPQPQRRLNPDAIDLNDLPALGASFAAPVPVTAPVATPGLVPTTPTPQMEGINIPANLSAAPAANPTLNATGGTGTSTAGLETASNTTGRPDNAAPRTATSPSSHLSAATAAQAAAPGGTGQGTGMAGQGMPAMPFVPAAGVGGPTGGRTNKDGREPPKASKDSAELSGLITIGEAVQGGTINRREEGSGDDKR